VPAGYFFGNLPVVKNNLTAVIMLIILISVLPGIVEFIRHKRSTQAG
jgi:membrane-associated protein